MEITSVRLHALGPDARPQVIDIKATLGQTKIIGRQDFNSGDDTVISRRHALFSVVTGTEVGRGEQVLVVQNLSLINGILVNFTPVPTYGSQALVDGDEIVSTLFPIYDPDWAHGQTEKMSEVDLPTGAQKYRYTVSIQRGPRARFETSGATTTKKREGEPISPAQRRDSVDGTFKRAHIIELSSEGEDSPRPPMRPTTSAIVGVHQSTPITVGSTDSLDDRNADDEGVVLDLTGVTEEDIFDTLFSDFDDKMEGTSSSGGDTTASPEKGKGKEKEAVFELAIFDLQEELECFICLFKWREKSDSCPQCRVKLTDNEPFLRDYILERMVEKYAKLKLSTEELKERDIATAKFHRDQREKKEPMETFIPWSDRAKNLDLYIPPSQQTLTINDIVQRIRDGNPPGFESLSPRGQAEYHRWRNECLMHEHLNGRLAPNAGNTQTQTVGRREPFAPVVHFMDRRRSQHFDGRRTAPTTVARIETVEEMRRRSEVVRRAMGNATARTRDVMRTFSTQVLDGTHVDEEWLREVSAALSPDEMRRVQADQRGMMSRQRSGGGGDRVLVEAEVRFGAARFEAAVGPVGGPTHQGGQEPQRQMMFRPDERNNPVRPAFARRNQQQPQQQPVQQQLPQQQQPPQQVMQAQQQMQQQQLPHSIPQAQPQQHQQQQFLSIPQQQMQPSHQPHLFVSGFAASTLPNTFQPQQATPGVVQTWTVPPFVPQIQHFTAFSPGPPPANHVVPGAWSPPGNHAAMGSPDTTMPRRQSAPGPVWQ